MPETEPEEKGIAGECPVSSADDTGDTEITSDCEERLKHSEGSISESLKHSGNILNIATYLSDTSMDKLGELSKEGILSQTDSPVPSSVKSSTPHSERIPLRKRRPDESVLEAEVKRKKLTKQIEGGCEEVSVSSSQEERGTQERRLKEELIALREKYEELEGKYLKVIEAQSTRKKIISQEDLSKNLKIVKSTFFGVLTYYIDEETKEVILVTLGQSKLDVNRSSTSSGYQPDSTSSESSIAWSGPMFSLPSSRHSSSSTSSISSSVSSTATTLIHQKDKSQDFAVPVPPPRLQDFTVPVPPPRLFKGSDCVCTCFCSNIFWGSEASSDLVSSIKSSSDSREEELLREESVIIDPPESPKIPEEVAPVEEAPLQNTDEGLLVFSKWPGDSWYYPGIVENEKETSWKTRTHLNVRFFDNNILRKIATIHMFPAHLIIPGIEVRCKETVDYAPYTVVGISRIPEKKKRRGHPSIIFKVREGNEEKTFPFDKVAIPDISFKALKRERGEELTPSLSAKKGHIDPEVLQSGKRKRTPKKLSFPDTPRSLNRNVPAPQIKSIAEDDTEQLGEPLDQPSSGKKEKMTSRTESPHPGPSCVRVESSVSGSISSSSDTESSVVPLQLNVQSDLFDEESISPSKTSTKTISGRKVKSSMKKPQEDPELERQLGPIPTDALFSGYVFVITHTRNSSTFPRDLGNSQSGSTQSESSDAEEHFELLHPFDFLRLKAQILSGGGEVFNYITDVPNEKIARTIVVTDMPCITPNYLLSIALGVPIYRHDLIINCCNRKRYIDQEINFAIRMPNGRSLETSRLIMENKSGSLKGYCCLLSLSNSGMVPIWKKLVSFAGGKAYSTYFSIPGGILSISFIIADEASLSPYLLSIANENRIPILSTTWLVQTVIHGSPRQPEDRPEYTLNTNDLQGS